MNTFTKIASAAAFAALTLSATPAMAGDYICGHFAFGGAFQNYSNAVNQANRLGAQVLDLDRSNSPNAGLGYWVVAKGPYGPRGARKKARQMRNWGANGAYAAHRCFNGV